MFHTNAINVFHKIAELRARIFSVGAPSEQVLYTRKSHQRLDASSDALPASARNQPGSAARLEQDSTSIIRKGVYSSSRF